MLLVNPSAPSTSLGTPLSTFLAAWHKQVWQPQARQTSAPFLYCGGLANDNLGARQSNLFDDDPHRDLSSCREQVLHFLSLWQSDQVPLALRDIEQPLPRLARHTDTLILFVDDRVRGALDHPDQPHTFAFRGSSDAFRGFLQQFPRLVIIAPEARWVNDHVCGMTGFIDVLLFLAGRHGYPFHEQRATYLELMAFYAKALSSMHISDLNAFSAEKLLLKRLEQEVLAHCSTLKTIDCLSWRAAGELFPDPERHTPLLQPTSLQHCPPESGYTPTGWKTAQARMLTDERWLHDLIYFNGPLSYRDLVNAYLDCFGQARYDGIKAPLTFLRNIGSLTARQLPYRGDSRWFYRSARAQPYFAYPFDEDKQMARARLYYLKHDPERLQ